MTMTIFLMDTLINSMYLYKNYAGAMTKILKDMIGEKKYDYVLASEVFYQRQSIDLLLQTMKMLVKPKLEGGLVVLRLTPELTDEAKGFDYLTSRMKKFGFDYKFVDTNNGSRDDDNDDEVDSSQLIICSVK